MSETEGMIPSNVTLSRADWDKATQVSQDHGQGENKSAGVRAIVAQWTQWALLVPELQRQIAELQQQIAVLEAR